CKIFLRCKARERTSCDCVVPSDQRGGGSVIAWGCFAGDTVDGIENNDPKHLKICRRKETEEQLN
ncbi:hypothetical protein Z043_116284, partial [Scleropages formosus]